MTNEPAGSAVPEPTARLPRPPGDFAGDPMREPTAFTTARETADSSGAEIEPDLIPGASLVGGRYRLLLFHGGPAGIVKLSNQTRI